MVSVPINDNTPRNQYTATAAQTTFAYTFWVYAETELSVYVNGTLRTLTTHYTVSAIQNDNGANIVFGSGLAEDDIVTIVRNTAKERLTGYTTGGSFTATVVNFEFGRFLAIIQDIAYKLGRSFTLSDTSTLSPSLTIPDPEASKLLGWNSGATALENKEVTVLGATTLPSVTGKDTWFGVVDEAGGTLAWQQYIQTADLADDAVTLAKMASGTAGKYIGYDGSGSPAELSIESDRPIPIYASASTLTVDGSTVDIATAGALGLEAGSAAEGTSHWVYLYECRGSSGTTYVLSRTNESASGTITAPTGYTTSKRQFPFAIRNDSSGDFIPWMVSAGWPQRPEILYRASTTQLNSGGSAVAGTLNVLSNGTSGGFTEVDLSSFVPPLSRRAILFTHNSTAACYASVREDATNTHQYAISMGATYSSTGAFNVPVDSAQSIDYKINFGSGSLYLDVYGFIVTEEV